jgi:uncharacterized membrane protein
LYKDYFIKSVKQFLSKPNNPENNDHQGYYQMAKKFLKRRIIRFTNPSKHNQDQIGLERLIFFSDSVFAIAITLLTLEIRLPTTNGPLTNSELFQNILGIGSKFIAYIISFLVIGLIWISHHRKFRLIQRYDSNLMLINLFLLMTIAFIPFPTSLISTYGNQTATIFYASVMILASLLSAAIWEYASYKDRLINPLLDHRRRRKEILGPLLTIGVFILSIGLAYINADLARISWVLVAVMPRFYK